MRVMLLWKMNGLPELTDGLTALTAWVMRQTEGEGELRLRCLTEDFDNPERNDKTVS